MNDDQENRRGRAGATAGVLAKYQAKIAGVAMLVAQAAELNDSIALIDDISQGQSSATKGVTLNKALVLDSMIRKALQVAGQLEAYASITKDAELKAKVSISETTFTRRRDEVRDELAQEIHDLAAARINELTDYGTLSTTLDALQTRIDLYTTAVESPRLAQAHVSTLTALLEKEIRRADMIQRDRLDPLMEQFSDTDEMLYTEYQNARKKIDAKGGAKSARNPPPAPTP